MIFENFKQTMQFNKILEVPFHKFYYINKNYHKHFAACRYCILFQTKNLEQCDIIIKFGTIPQV